MKANKIDAMVEKGFMYFGTGQGYREDNAIKALNEVATTI